MASSSNLRISAVTGGRASPKDQKLVPASICAQIIAGISSWVEYRSHE